MQLLRKLSDVELKQLTWLGTGALGANPVGLVTHISSGLFNRNHEVLDIPNDVIDREVHLGTQRFSWDILLLKRQEMSSPPQ